MPVPNRGTERSESQVDRSFVRWKRKKPVAIVILVVAILISLGNVTGAIQKIWDVFGQILEPSLTVSVDPVIPQPWYYYVYEFPPRPEHTPIPMWLMVDVTVHNRSNHSIWISNYSVSARTRTGWTQLDLPPSPIGNKDLVFLDAGELQAVNPGCTFDYKALRAPIPSDSYVFGRMFFASRVKDTIKALRFEFTGKNGERYRWEVNHVLTAEFGGGPLPPSAHSGTTGPEGCSFEKGLPLPPWLDAYRRQTQQFTIFRGWLH